MKFLKATRNNLVFLIGPAEKRLLFQVLKLYPLAPAAHQPLSKSGNIPDQDANQQLLEEALAAQRAENRRQVEAVLKDRRRFTRGPDGICFNLEHSRVEWLLQVLNDIRVGSWLLLGSPDEHGKERLKQTAERTPLYWAMEMAAHFQASLLSALESRG